MTKAVFNTKEAAGYLGLSASALETMRCTGRGPVFLKLSKAVRYRVSDLDSWLDARAVTSTSQLVAA